MAVNVRLIGGYLSDLASATASSTAAGYDPENAVVLDRSSLWIAGGTTSVTLTFDLGSAESVSAVCIANHNGSGWTTAKLQRSPDNAVWTDVVTLTGITTGEDYFQTFAAISYQYWRISIASATDAPQVGIFYLGTKTLLTENPDIGLEADDAYNVEVAVGQSGAIVAEQWGRRLYAVNAGWSHAGATVFGEVRTFIRGEGGPLRPFFYVPPDVSGSNDYGRAYLMRFRPPGFKWTEVFTNLYAMSLPLLEEV